MQDRLMVLRPEFPERCLLLEEIYYPELAKDEDAIACYHEMKFNDISKWHGNGKAGQMVQQGTNATREFDSHFKSLLSIHDAWRVLR